MMINSSYRSALFVKEYDDKDNNNATASFKAKFVAMRYESTDKKKEFDQKLSEGKVVPKLRFIPDLGDISLIGIKINSFQKTSLKVTDGNENFTYNGVSVDYSTYGISGKISKFSPEGHEEFLRLFSKINVIA